MSSAEDARVLLDSLTIARYFVALEAVEDCYLARYRYFSSPQPFAVMAALAKRGAHMLRFECDGDQETIEIWFRMR